MNIEQICKFIPHRYPFLLIDRVVRIEDDRLIFGFKNVTINEPFFLGHFPTQAVMPGVLIVEALAQIAGLLIMHALAWPENHGHIFYLAGIEKTRFKRIVIPGDTLDLKAEMLTNRQRVFKFSVQATVNEQLVCSSELLLAGPETTC